MPSDDIIISDSSLSASPSKITELTKNCKYEDDDSGNDDRSGPRIMNAEKRSPVAQEAGLDVEIATDESQKNTSVHDGETNYADLFYEDYSAGDEAATDEQPDSDASKDSASLGIDLTDPNIFCAKKGGNTCFNCLGAHNVMHCKQPLDQEKIEERRRKHWEVHSHSPNHRSTVSNYTPGVLSDSLRQALGLEANQYPEWVYRMRNEGSLKGYPPGYFLQLLEGHKKAAFVTPNASLAKDVQEVDFCLNESLIVYYDGFNVIDLQTEAANCGYYGTYGQLWKPYTKESYVEELTPYVVKCIKASACVLTPDRSQDFDFMGRDPCNEPKVPSGRLPVIREGPPSLPRGTFYHNWDAATPKRPARAITRNAELMIQQIMMRSRTPACANGPRQSLPAPVVTQARVSPPVQAGEETPCDTATAMLKRILHVCPNDGIQDADQAPENDCPDAPPKCMSPFTAVATLPFISEASLSSAPNPASSADGKPDMSGDSRIPLASSYISPPDDSSRTFYVPKSDDRDVPELSKFSEGITPFAVDNVMERGDFFEKLRALRKNGSILHYS